MFRIPALQWQPNLSKHLNSDTVQFNWQDTRYLWSVTFRIVQMEVDLIPPVSQAQDPSSWGESLAACSIWTVIQFSWTDRRPDISGWSGSRSPLLRWEPGRLQHLNSDTAQFNWQETWYLRSVRFTIPALVVIAWPLAASEQRYSPVQLTGDLITPVGQVHDPRSCGDSLAACSIWTATQSLGIDCYGTSALSYHTHVWGEQTNLVMW
jgi:hypothetical protein